MNTLFISRPTFVALITSIIFLHSCKEESIVQPDLTVQQTYDTTGFAAAKLELSQSKSEYTTMINLIKTGRNGTKLEYAALEKEYTSNLRQKTTSYYQSLIPKIFSELAAASAGIYNPALTPEQNGSGGVFGDKSKYLFNQYGTEPEQLADKGLYGAMLYNTALQYLTDDATLDDIHKALTYYGAHPDFPNSNNSTKHNNPDNYAAGYAARRDDNSGNGLYTLIKRNFLIVQAAIKAGNNYNKEKREALIAIKTLWEKALAATMVNYLYSVTTNLSKTSPTTDEISVALHSWSECIGFVEGFKTIPEKMISDAQIDEFLSTINAPVKAPHSGYAFVQKPAESLSKLNDAMMMLKNIYGFSNEEMISFRENWVTKQNR